MWIILSFMKILASNIPRLVSVHPIVRVRVYFDLTCYVHLYEIVPDEKIEPCIYLKFIMKPGVSATDIFCLLKNVHGDTITSR